MIESKNNAETILITGSTGLIGQALLRELTARNNNRLRLLVRDQSRATAQIEKIFSRSSAKQGLPDYVDLVEGDLTEFTDKDFVSLVKGCQSVVHLAGLVHNAQASEQDYQALNVEATEQLVSAAQSNGVHTFLFMSTIAVYGRGPLVMVEEGAALAGETPYAVSKISCEKIIEDVSSIRRTIILRPALVFGEGDRGNMIKLIQAINKGRYINIGKGDTAKSLIYAGDLAAVINLCLQRLPAGKYVFNAANPRPVCMNELAGMISFSLGKSGKISSMPEPLLKTLVQAADLFIPGPIRKQIPVNKDQISKLLTNTTCCVDKLVQMVGFAPRYTLPAALMAEICWANANGTLSLKTPS